MEEEKRLVVFKREEKIGVEAVQSVFTKGNSAVFSLVSYSLEISVLFPAY